VRFTVPLRTTDGLPIRDGDVLASLCRGGEGAPCVEVAGLKDVRLKVAAGSSAAERAVSWVDRLPAAETSGDARLLIYRVELKNEQGRTAGWSVPAYAAAGAGPEAVEGLRAEETRTGVLLRWQPGPRSAGDEVLLRREAAAPVADKAEEPVWLESHAAANGPAADETVDGSASEDMVYRYVAVRRRAVAIGARKLEIRSALSGPVEITWRNRFPPAAPAELSAAPFAENGAFAVDLVWEPVEQPGLKGYVVTRQAVDSGGAPVGAAERLGSVALPAFHDATAKPGVRYRYTVQAVSAKGVEGAVATVVMEPAE
jgi:hypothetical protein